MPKKRLDNIIWQAKNEKWWYNFWKGVKEPWRPSSKEIKFWERIVQQVFKKRGFIRVLVLGATPEIRDMLAKYKKIETTLIDVNPVVKRAMDRLRKRKNNQEKIIWADWLEMPLPSNYFDIVFNDDGFENIALKSHDKLHRNIRRVLKKDGYFLVGRLCLEYCFKHVLTLDQILRKYKKDSNFFRNFYNRIWYLYRLVASDDFYYDKRGQAVLMNNSANRILAKAKEAGIKNPKALVWDPRVGYNDISYKEIDLASLKRLKTMIGKYFEIKQTYQDLFHPVMKIKYNFVLKPKE